MKEPTKPGKRVWVAYFQAYPLVDGDMISPEYEVGYVDRQGSKLIVRSCITDLSLRALEATWIEVELLPKLGLIVLSSEKEGWHPRWRVHEQKAELLWSEEPLEFPAWGVDGDP